MKTAIRIFHTNDIHSHLDNYNAISHYINEHKNDISIYVDIGDHVDRSHPYTEATLGLGNVKLLNDAQCDVATIGNNEGITLSKKDLEHLYDDAKFEVVCANLRDDNGLLFKPYTIKCIGDLKIGFIAATVEFTPFYRALGLDVEGAFLYIEEYLKEMRHQCDAIVMLSHLGKYDDERLATEFKEIDIIIGGHTHHKFPDDYFVNDTLITSAGRFGEYFGYVDLEFEDYRLVRSSSRIIDTNLLTNNYDAYYDVGKDMLRKEVKRNVLKIERTLYTINWFTYTMLKMIQSYTNTDVSMIHAGLIAASFRGGTLTEYNLHKVLPHAINLIKIEMSGRDLKDMYYTANAQETKDEIIKGLGFRGDVMGVFLIDGLSVIESKREFYINGKMIDDDKIYTVGTLDMYSFGRFFPHFNSLKKTYYMPEFLRDIVNYYSDSLLTSNDF